MLPNDSTCGGYIGTGVECNVVEDEWLIFTILGYLPVNCAVEIKQYLTTGEVGSELR